MVVVLSRRRREGPSDFGGRFDRVTNARQFLPHRCGREFQRRRSGLRIFESSRKLPYRIANSSVRDISQRVNLPLQTLWLQRERGCTSLLRQLALRRVNLLISLVTTAELALDDNGTSNRARETHRIAAQGFLEFGKDCRRTRCPFDARYFFGHRRVSQRNTVNLFQH